MARFGILMTQRDVKGESASRLLTVYFESQEQAEAAACTLASLPNAKFAVVPLNRDFSENYKA
jgi:hypothetical protein